MTRCTAVETKDTPKQQVETSVLAYNELVVAVLAHLTQLFWHKTV